MNVSKIKLFNYKENNHNTNRKIKSKIKNTHSHTKHSKL